MLKFVEIQELFLPNGTAILLEDDILVISVGMTDEFANGFAVDDEVVE